MGQSIFPKSKAASIIDLNYKAIIDAALLLGNIDCPKENSLKSYREIFGYENPTQKEEKTENLLVIDAAFNIKKFKNLLKDFEAKFPSTSSRKIIVPSNNTRKMTSVKQVCIIFHIFLCTTNAYIISYNVLRLTKIYRPKYIGSNYRETWG